MSLSIRVEVSTSAVVLVVSSLICIVVVVVVAVVIVVVVVVVEDSVDVSVVVTGGQLSFDNPLAIVSPSGQHPNAVMSQVMRRGQPSASGPAAGVWPSAQQPYSVSYNNAILAITRCCHTSTQCIRCYL